MVSTVMQQRSREELRQIIYEFANLPLTSPDAETKAQAFTNSYGELHPIRNSPSDVIEAVSTFRKFWNWKAQPEFEIKVLEAFTETLFTWPWPTDPHQRPAVRLNFYEGTWEPSPRCLVEAIAVELVRARTMLYRCERPECQKYFVKEHSRDRYCSYDCGRDMRSRKQAQWALDHSKLISKRRKSAKKRGRK